MIDGLLAALERIQGRAATVAAAFDDAVAVAPAEATGTDASGAVTARLGPDGLPTVLHVASDWAGRLGPEQLGPAAVAACGAAAAQRSAEWGRRLEDTSWRARADARLARPAAPRSRSTTARPAAPVRPPDAIARDAHATLRTAGRPAPPRTATGTSGPADGDRLTLTLHATGSIGCDAPPRWVAGRTGAMLTDALTAALADGRRTLDAAPDLDGRIPRSVDLLLAEALTALTPPQPRS